MTTFAYNSPNRLMVGFGLPVRVNLSLGTERVSTSVRETRKLRSLLQSPQPPDLLMDLSVAANSVELWQVAREHFSGPIGILPHYLDFSEIHGLNPTSLLNRMREVIEGGVNFLTIHCTPTIDLLDLAKRSRRTPITSRGGGLVIRDMLINRRNSSIFSTIFPEICELARRTNCVINLGTAFRSSSVADGFDAVCVAELKEQASYCDTARKFGVNIVIEGPGHIQMHQIPAYWKQIEPLQAPPMPLGPIVSDTDPDMDHVSAAMGASFLMQLSKGGIINSITRIEHQGGVPTLALSLEGLRTARLAAQAASLTYCDRSFQSERCIANKRADSESCVLGKNDQGCSRCSILCPLISKSYSQAGDLSNSVKVFEE